MSRRGVLGLASEARSRTCRVIPEGEQSKVASVARSRMASMMRLKVAPSWKVASNMTEAGECLTVRFCRATGQRWREQGDC